MSGVAAKRTRDREHEERLDRQMDQIAPRGQRPASVAAEQDTAAAMDRHREELRQALLKMTNDA